MLFTAYPVIFTQGYGLNAGEEGLTFIPLFVGGVVGAFIVCLPFVSGTFGSSLCFPVPLRLRAQVQRNLCSARTTFTPSRGPTPYGKLGRTYVCHRNLLVGLD